MDKDTPEPQDQQAQDPFDQEFDDTEEPEPQDSAPPDGDTIGEGTEEPPKAEPWRRVRDDLYRRQSKMEQMLQQQAQMFNQQMGQLQGTLQGFIANQQKGAGGEPQQESELTPEVEQQYWEQRPGEVARYLIKQQMAKERERLRQEVLEEVQSSSTQATTMRRIYHDFPELRNEVHPFTVKANEIYAELAGEFGGPGAIPQGSSQQLMLVQMAAERAARLHPDAREDGQQNQRRERGTRDTQMTSNGSLTRGRPGPGRKKSSKVEDFTQDDFDIAKRWKINLQDEKVAERIKQSKKDLAAMRLAPKFPEEEQ